jgi:perosamine synthetase
VRPATPAPDDPAPAARLGAASPDRPRAIAGVDDPITVFRPVVEDGAIAAVNAVLRSGWPGPGPAVERFEESFARYVGAPHAVAVSSCTAALHLALLLLEVGPGDEVITTPITFVGANEVILMAGATPVFADVDPSTGLLDPTSVAERVTPRTRAVIVTHLSGTPADLDALYAVAERRSIAVVEDAAHACGSAYRGVRIGGHPGMQAFSFQATKNLNAVDGGMLCVRSPELAARARRLRWMGISDDTWTRGRRGAYRWAYRVDELGQRYTMSDLNAAMGLAHLGTLEVANERRRSIARRYREGLRGLPGVAIPAADPDSRSATYFSPVLVDGRDELCSWLAAHGIGSSVHFRRNDAHELFGPAADLPGAERYWRRAITLPLHLRLTDHDVARVIDAVGAFARRPAGRREHQGGTGAAVAAEAS